MSVLERTTEIGTMMAVGSRRAGVLRMFIFEGMMIGVFGGLIGLGVGYGIAELLSTIGIPMPPPWYGGRFHGPDTCHGWARSRCFRFGFHDHLGRQRNTRLESKSLEHRGCLAVQPMMRFVSNLFVLALRNLFRHRSRTLATLFAIALGVASMILASGFVKDILIQLGEATIHSQTGHIQLATPAYWASRSRTSDSLMIENPTASKQVLASVPGIEQIVSRVNFVGMVSNGKRDLAIVGEGIEPDGERKIGSFIQYTEGRPLDETDSSGMVIGQGIARSLNLQVGDSVTLILSLSQGAINTMDFQIVGIFQSFSKEFDARAIRIPLVATQELLDTKSAHLLVITLNQTKETDSVADAIRTSVKDQELSVKIWREISDFYEKTVQLYDAQFGVLRMIIFLMVLLSVANSINMTLYERTREFGTLLALGNRPQTVFDLIMIETVLLGLIGTGLGMVVGCLVASIISAIGIPMPPPPNSNLGYTALIRLEPIAVLISGTIGFFATVFAALYPARRATKINIVDALRQGV